MGRQKLGIADGEDVGIIRKKRTKSFKWHVEGSKEDIHAMFRLQ